MKIGVPKEIKNNENRVGLVPGGVRQLVHDGHEVFVETNAGAGIGIAGSTTSRFGHPGRTSNMVITEIY